MCEALHKRGRATQGAKHELLKERTLSSEITWLLLDYAMTSLESALFTFEQG